MSYRIRYRVLSSDGEVIADNVSAEEAQYICDVHTEQLAMGGASGLKYTYVKYEHDDGLFKGLGRDPDLH